MKITVTPSAIPDVLIIEPKMFADHRGQFYESYNHQEFQKATGLNATFVQDNHSRSARGVVRGMHYQIKHPQGKLVRAVVGEVFDVAVDIRRTSPTFAKWVGVRLSAENRRQVWLPPGFAHGFLALSDAAELLYKTTDYWYPEHERTLMWDDKSVGIDWPLNGEPILAKKDLAGSILNDIEAFA